MTHRILAIMLRQFYLIRGSFSRFIPLFAWVTLDIVLWGFLSRYLERMTGEMKFIPLFLGAILLWDFLVRVMQGVTIAFFEDVWSRNLLNIFASPLTIHEYILGLVGTSITTSAVGLIVMLILSTTVFGLSFGLYGALFVPFMLVLFMFGIALGIFSTAMVLRLGPSSEWFVWPVPALLAPLAGVFYPVATLPEWMQVIAHGLPPSYVFESMRMMIDGKGVPFKNLLLSLELSAIYIALAAWFFARTYRYAIRSGLIARYSAETAN